MQRWSRLNDRQLTVLRRIGECSDQVSAKNPELALTVYALRGRGLVTTPRRGGIWVAEITDAGRFYLEHGHHPDKPKDVPAASIPAPPPPPPRLPDGKDLMASELIERLCQEGGTIRVPEPDDETRKRYRSTISLAKRRGLVPAGHHLLHTGRDMGDLIIRLESDTERDETDWNRIRLEARDIVTDPERVAERLAEDQESIDVPEPLFPRAVSLVQALGATLGQHGYKFGISRRRRPPGLFIHARGCQFPVRITEAEAGDGEQQLLVEIQISADGQVRSWTDDRQIRLEDKLAVIAEEFEPLAAAAENRRIERERAYAAQLEQWRREDEERERDWKAAMTRARRQAREEHRQQAFGEALEDWHAAARIRAFCSALEQAAAANPGKQQNAVRRWVAWGRSRADRIDPATTLSVLIDAGFDFEPGSDDLRPFLDGWSPEEPEREWRPKRERLADDDGYTETQKLRSPFRVPWWQR
jgi:hypothetical protein